jgi:hypothetical protein
MKTVVLLFFASAEVERLTKSVEESGRVLELVESPSERVAPRPQIAPGAPPLLTFRLLDAKDRHRYGDLDLVLDDAGH